VARILVAGQNPLRRCGVITDMHHARGCLVLLLLATACGRPPVGYAGPLPSGAAQVSLNALLDKTLPAGSVAFCAHELRVRGFLVMAPLPALIVEDQTAAAAGRTVQFSIPVLQDGDVADLHLRITGVAPAGMPRDLSDAYRRMMTGP
jgi:hypothetical protein